MVLAFCLMPTLAFAQQYYLEWNKNTESDLSHYRVYWCDPGQGIDLSNPYNCNRANQHGTWIPALEDLGATVRTTLQTPTDQQVFFVTAFDFTGNESGESNRVQFVSAPPPDTTPPGAPGNLKLTVTPGE